MKRSRRQYCPPEEMKKMKIVGEFIHRLDDISMHTLNGHKRLGFYVDELP